MGRHPLRRRCRQRVATPPMTTARGTATTTTTTNARGPRGSDVFSARANALRSVVCFVRCGFGFACLAPYRTRGSCSSFPHILRARFNAPRFRTRHRRSTALRFLFAFSQFMLAVGCRYVELVELRRAKQDKLDRSNQDFSDESSDATPDDGTTRKVWHLLEVCPWSADRQWECCRDIVRSLSPPERSRQSTRRVNRLAR